MLFQRGDLLTLEKGGQIDTATFRLAWLQQILNLVFIFGMNGSDLKTVCKTKLMKESWYLIIMILLVM